MAELMSEHEDLALVATQATTALAAGDKVEAVSRCAELARRFAAHGQKEEQGLFLQLRREHQAEAVVTRLESEHRQLEVGLRRLAAGDLGEMQAVLGLLLEHATREDTDLFPAALMLLSNDGWAQVSSGGA